VRECGDAGVKVAVVFAGGFDEATAAGRGLRADLIDAIADTGIRLLGPNSLGAIGFTSAFTGTITTAISGHAGLKSAPIALLGQSGAIGSYMLSAAQAAGIGFARFAATGNELDVTAVELARSLVEDDAVRVLLLYLEGLRDGGAFVELAQRASDVDKPLIVMKVARSSAGARAAVSHTGSLAIEDEVFDAIARQHSVLRVESMAAAIDALKIFANSRRAAGNRLTVGSDSGGVAALVADSAADHGIEIPDWTHDERAQIEQVLPPAGSADNPVDLGGAIDLDAYRAVLAVIIDHAKTDAAALVIGNVPPLDADALIEVVEETYRRTDKPFVVSWSGGLTPHVMPTLTELGLPVYDDPSEAMAALGLLIRWSTRVARCRVEAPEVRPSDSARHVVARARTAGQTQLDEFQSKALLSEFGIACITEQAAETPEAAVQAAASVGYPVAVKLLAARVSHKTELGGVRLDLRSSNEVRAAAEGVLATAREHAISEPRVLVQRMADEGLEMLLGAKHDPTFGPVVLVGLGGIFVEYFGDFAIGRPPLSLSEAHQMLESLRASRLLDGPRGTQPADRAALAVSIVRLGQMILDLENDIEEVDLNPVVVYPNGRGLVAVDALVTLRASGGAAEDA
jgi:acyl-CoA synthetase (NDP forming)